MPAPAFTPSLSDAGVQQSASLAPKSVWDAPIAALRANALSVDPELTVATFLELFGAARRAGFEGVEFARGAEVLPLEDHPEKGLELEFVFLGRDRWSLYWPSERAAQNRTESDNPARLASDVEAATATWVNAPCHLSVVATADTPLSIAVEGAMAVSRGRRCVRGFALGVFAERGDMDSVVWSTPQGTRGRVLTLRVPSPPPPRAVPAVREERTVQVGGVTEIWRIRWRDAPVDTCFTWVCGCNHPSQRGHADLVRSRPGAKDEVLSLNAFFEGEFDEHSRSTEVVLAAWPSLDGDAKLEDSDSNRAIIRSRQLVQLMELHDYDHDGRATEFLLHIGGVGCVFQHYVAVGVSRRNPRLHFFGSAAHPERPLELGRDGWKTLEEGNGTYVESHCGNHGGEWQTEIALRADRAGIRGTTVTYECPREQGRVISRTRW